MNEWMNEYLLEMLYVLAYMNINVITNEYIVAAVLVTFIRHI